MHDLREALTGICGEEHVRACEGSWMVSPADADQIAAVLRIANESGTPVRVQGGGTKEAWLNPASDGIILSTLRINSMRDHTWQDMTCTVEAGCTWAAMQQQLAQHGQFVALDPLWPETATVGGVLCANDSGSLRLKYGGLRDLIIGCTVVTADGVVSRSGGKVVKNVAGYDLSKLMCGSFGTLAVVVEVNFRLHSLPQSTSSLTIVSPSGEPLSQLMMKLMDSYLSLRRLQLRADTSGFALDVELAAMPGTLAAQTDTILAMAEHLQIKPEAAASEIWLSRQKSISEHPVAFKATLLPTEMAAFLASIQRLDGSVVAQSSGVAFGSLPSCEGVEALRRSLSQRGGSLTLLSSSVADPTERWGAAPASFPVMQQLKQRFDPNRILNPGRFLGGI